MNIIKSIDQQQVMAQHQKIDNHGDEKKKQMSFKETLTDVLNEVNDLQINAKESVEKFLSGEIEDVHQVMIEAEKASVGLELTLEVRNKILEAYREVMRMSG